MNQKTKIMKKRKHTLIALMSILSFVFAMSIQSCGKRDAWKNIEACSDPSLLC